MIDGVRAVFFYYLSYGIYDIGGLIVLATAKSNAERHYAGISYIF